MPKKWKKQKANQQNPKKHKSKIKGEEKRKKGKSKRGKKGKQRGKHGETMYLSICIFFHLFCFFDLLFFAFIFGKKQKNKQNNTKKTNRKSKISAKKCKWTSPFFPIFFHLFDVPFFHPFILLPVFFSLKFCFVFIFFKFQHH